MADESGSSDGHVDALRVTCEEGRETLGEQIESLRRVDRKAIQILRVNILVIGAILTGLSIAVRSETAVLRFVNVASVLGAGTLLLSSTGAAMTYVATSFESGIAPDAIRSASRDSLTEAMIHRRLSNGYARWIEYNESALKMNGALLTLTILLLIDSIGLLSAGGILGAMGVSRTWYSAAASIVVLLVLAVLNFLTYKLDLWIHTHYLMRRESER